MLNYQIVIVHIFQIDRTINKEIVHLNNNDKHKSSTNRERNDFRSTRIR